MPAPLSAKARADAQKYLDVVYLVLAGGSVVADGVTKYDSKIADVSLAAEHRRVSDEQKALDKLTQARDKESDAAVKRELTDYLQGQQAALGGRRCAEPSGRLH